VSFRKSHEIVGDLVATLIEKDETFSDFDTVEKILKKSGLEVPFGDLRNMVDTKKAVHAYKSTGSTSPKEVSAMIQEFKEEIKENEKNIKQRTEKISNAKQLTEGIVKEVLAGKDMKKARM